jgi:PAS domain S-box-containing protein
LQTGYTAVEISGRRLDELLFGPSTNSDSVRGFQHALSHGHELTDDVLEYRRDGRTFWVECRLIPVHDENGVLTRWIAVQTDITRRRQTEEALLAAKHAAELNSRSKSEFLANMSHEIRTPLNAILGMTELALTTDLNREQRDYLQTVQSSADTLLQLLNDVLDISKIEVGKMEIEDADFNLAELIRETAKALAVRAHEKDLELAAHVPMDLPIYLRGDPTRVRQVLFNLVGNAIKFTEHGEVVVAVEEQWRNDEHVCLHFSVKDTGIGIPRERLQQIFESFTQVDSSISRRYGGTGLGLTISAQLLRLMNGKIWVQSKQGAGSTFHFTLQLKISKRPDSIDLEPTQLQGKTALIVDDNATNRRILEEMLRHWGMKPTLSDAADGALRELEDAAQRNEAFDVVLLDAMMPKVDGFQLAEMIEERNDLKCGTVMMLSSSDRPTSASRCQVLGIDSYLMKPVSASTLLEAILAALADRSDEHSKLDFGPSASRLQQTKLAHSPTRPLRVLVVDDHQPNRNLAMKILERRGHHCVPADDGDEAIAACAQSAYDVVLMDIQMPGRDGISATRAIRERERSKGGHVPIVALTAHALSGDREECLSVGMDAYLPKPIHARELVALVERVTGVLPESDDKTTQHVACETKAQFDLSAALKRMDGEMDLLKEHIGYVLNDVPQLIERMHEAINQRDNRLLEISGHRLKSLVSSYDHNQARELALTIERMGKTSQFDEAAAALERLQPLIDEFLDVVRDYLAQQT